MGEVYRARDTKLDRDVAIKILPEAFAHDSDRLARFQREAKTLASLNHPNIAIIHGLEQAGDVHALVMELVEGDDLSQRIARGAIPLDEALPIAKQIAEALEAAHEQGIIHRDLKPANIKVRSDGTVKVLDFGLAKAMEPAAGSSPSMSMAPTITTPALMTGAGIILGTAAYMAPEQARGKVVDKRADIWAFGAVLFEMLTGKRAFPGEDLTDTLAAVVKLDPKWEALAADVPARVRQVLRACLQKDPKQRMGDVQSVRLALEGAFETAVPLTTVATPSSTHRGRRPLIAALAVAVVAMIALAVPALRHLREAPPPAPPETRVDIVTPATDAQTSFALSPDGRQIVYAASSDGTSRLWLRSLATTTTAQPLAGTEGATHPFWAPDGRAIGFFTTNALKRLDLGGGAPQTLAPATVGTGATWNADGVIVFAPSRTTPLMRVSASGGSAEAVTVVGPLQQGHVAPSFLPDGRRFLFYVVGAPDTAGVYLGALDGSAPTRVTPAESTGVYLPAVPGLGGQTPLAGAGTSGWLMWVRAGALVAQRLDVTKAALTGTPVTMADGVAVDGLAFSSISVAGTGLVAYRTGGGTQRQLMWFDRAGTARGAVGDADATFANPRVSPDGRRVVVSRLAEGNTDVWLLDGARVSRFTFDSASDQFPLWSPDGTRIVFRSSRTGVGDLYLKHLSGAGGEERLLTSDRTNTPSSWSADGRFLLDHVADPQTNLDLWVVPMVGDRTPSLVLKTPFREGWGAFSPDGRWVAYYSNESGRNEIYVRPFVAAGVAGTVAEATGSQWQVSTTGGVYPTWSRDGKELYYLNPAGAMTAAPMTVTGATIEPGAPVVLFPTHIFGGGVDAQQGRQYDVAPDGRFLINTVMDSAAAPITLIQNWQPGN